MPSAAAPSAPRTAAASAAAHWPRRASRRWPRAALPAVPPPRRGTHRRGVERPHGHTPAGVPFFESSRDGHLHAGLGFSGHGLAATKVGGKTLASLVLHEDDEWSRLPVVGPPLAHVPPEPVRWPLVCWGVAWRTRAATWPASAGARAGRAECRRARVRCVRVPRAPSRRIILSRPRDRALVLRPTRRSEPASRRTFRRMRPS